MNERANAPTLDAPASARPELRPSERPTQAGVEVSGERGRDEEGAEVGEGSVLLGRYVLGAELGRGGMGTVYAARHLITEAEVAIKVLSAALAQDKTVSARFLREARTAAALRHPNAIRVSDVLELPGGGAAIVMERLIGQSLSDRLREAGRLTLGETARIWLPVLEALGEAHGKGIVHRDIKPSNIFLHEERGEVVPKLLDFGIAKAAPREQGGETEHLTQTGSMLGTPSYMSPEQVSGQRHVDARADLWSVGVTLYQSLSGHMPFDGENLGQIFSSILLRAPLPLDALVPDLPPSVVRLTSSCLLREREGRPQSCEAIALVLREFEGEPSAQTLPVPERPDPPTTSPPPAFVEDGESLGGSLPIPLTRTAAQESGTEGRHVSRYAALGLLVIGLGALGWASMARPSVETSETTSPTSLGNDGAPDSPEAAARRDDPTDTPDPRPPSAIGERAGIALDTIDAVTALDAGLLVDGGVTEIPRDAPVAASHHAKRRRWRRPAATHEASPDAGVVPSMTEANMGGLFHTL